MLYMVYLSSTAACTELKMFLTPPGTLTLGPPGKSRQAPYNLPLDKSEQNKCFK